MATKSPPKFATPRIRRHPSTAQSSAEKKKQGLARGYIYGVAPSPAKPTHCSVLVDDKMPPRPGFTLPKNCGPIYPAGTTTIPNNGSKSLTKPFTGPFSTDFSTMLGGSQVVVDLDTKTVVTILHGVNQFFPSSGDYAISTHVHTGGVDQNGNPMPDPIDSNSLAANPNPSVAPNLVYDGPISFTYVDVGNVSYDAVIGSFQTDILNPAWLRGLLLFAVRSGQPHPNANIDKPHMSIPPTESGIYTGVVVRNLAAGNDWDLYISYQDHEGGVCPVTFVATTASPELSAPGLTSCSSPVYTDAGNISFDVEFTVQLDAFPDWKRDVLFALTRSTGVIPDGNTTVHTRIPSAASGTYDVKMKNLASGVGSGAAGWVVWAAYEDYRKQPTPWTEVIQLASNPASIPGSGLAPMPSGIKSSGPTITSATIERIFSFGSAQRLDFVATQSDFTSASLPNWISAIELVIRNTGDGNTQHHTIKQIDPNNVNGSGQFEESIPAWAGNSMDVGVRYVALAGGRSQITWPLTTIGVIDPDGNLFGSDGTTTWGRQHVAVTTALNQTGQGLLNNFPGSTAGTGATLNTDGSLTNLSDQYSAEQHALSAGQVFRHEFELAPAGTDNPYLIMGSTGSGYAIWANMNGAPGLAADYKVRISRFVRGTRYDIATSTATLPTGTTLFHLRFAAIVVGASNNLLEASIGPIAIPQTADTNIDLTTGTWGTTPYFGQL